MQILVTELGDETFIIAAIMAMRHPRLVVYIGAMSALLSMTVGWHSLHVLYSHDLLTQHAHALVPNVPIV